MKFALTNFNENGLLSDLKPQNSEIINTLLQIRQTFKEIKSVDLDDIARSEKISELEQKVKTQMKNLVKPYSPLWQRINLQHAKDIFNDASELLEKIQDSDNTEDIKLLLSFLGIFVVNYSANMEKPDNITIVQKLALDHEDIKIQLYAMKIAFSLSSRRQQDIMEKALNIALAANLLRSVENHLTLYQIANGQLAKDQNKPTDIVFEIEQQSQGLNERIQTNTVNLSIEEFLESKLSAKEFSNNLAKKYSQDSKTFIEALITKIQWLVFLHQSQSPHQAVINMLDGINMSQSYQEVRHQKLLTYLKDKAGEELMDLVQKSSDELLVMKAQTTLINLIQKHQGNIIPIDIFVRPGVLSQDQLDDDMTRPFIVRLVDDVSSVHLQYDFESKTPTKVARTKTLNSLIAISDVVQFQSVQLIYTIFRVIQTQHNRSQQVYQELINMLTPNLFKIIQNVPDDNGFYTYHIMVQQQVLSILKIILRPRLEEQHDIVAKLTTRLTFEFDQIQESFKILKDDGSHQLVDNKERQSVIKQIILILSDMVSRDQQNTGIGRKICESQTLNVIQKIFELNTEENIKLIEDFISRTFTLIGALCSDNPARIPDFIRNGLIPAVIKSLENRIPNSPDIIDSVIYGINQFSIHDEGLRIVSESSIFRKILEHVISDKVNVPYEQMIIRIYMNNLFDRIPSFKDIAKECIFMYLDVIQQYGTQKAIQYIKLMRDQTLDDKQKQEKLTSDNKVPSNIIAALTIIQSISVLSNDNQAQNRHSIDIMTDEVCQKLLDTYLNLIQVPSLAELQISFEKIIKVVYEAQVFPNNVKNYQAILVEQLIHLNSLVDLQKQKSRLQFDNYDQYQLANLKEIDELNFNNLAQFLTLGEQQLFQLQKFQNLVKSTHFLHTATFHTIIQNKEIIKFTKTAFFLKQYHNRVNSDAFSQKIQKLKIDQNTAENEPFQSVFETYDSNDLNLGQKMSQIRIFLNSLENESKEFPSFKVKVRYLEDYMNKLCVQTFNQRHSSQKEPLELCLMFLGKLISILTNKINKQALQKIQVEPSINFAISLFEISETLNEIYQKITHGFVEGAAFYMFFKKCGVLNLIECFQWLSEMLHKVDNKFMKIHIHLFDQSCVYLMQIFQHLVSSKNNENSLNSILSTDMGNNYDNAKNLYQTFYHLICTNLLQVDQAASKNAMMRLQHSRNTLLQEIVLNVLQLASKSFSNCILLKENAKDLNKANKNQNQADPEKVNQLLAMGFMMTKEKIQQALVQSKNNIERAVNLLMEWQYQGDFDSQAPQKKDDVQFDDGIVSEQSDEDISSFEDPTAMQNVTKAKVIRQVPKVTENQYLEIVKKTQQQGFQWVIEALGTQESLLAKLREYIQNQMQNEKNEAQQKYMYSEVDRLFKTNMEGLTTKLNDLKEVNLEEKKQQVEGEDQIMTEINTTDNSKLYEQINRHLETTQSDLSLVTRLINNSKQYLKEALLKSDVFIKVIQLIERLTNLYNTKIIQQFTNDEIYNMNYQKVILEGLVMLFTIVQLYQLKVVFYQSQKSQVEQFQKKIQDYTRKVPLTDLFKLIIKIFKEYQIQVDTYDATENKHLIYRKPIVMTIASIGLKIIQQKESSNFSKVDLAQQLFTQLSQIKYPKVVKSEIIYGVTINHFENQKLLQNQIEKLSQRAMWLKSEYEHKLEHHANRHRLDSNKEQNQQLATSHLKGKAGFNNFLKYFQILQNKDQATFKQILKDNFEVHTVKKMNQMSQDLATINLKEQKFNELKKVIHKERTTLKQFSKLIDFKTDKAVKAQVKQSKKQLLQIVNEQQCGAIQNFITQISQRSTQFLDLLSQYNAAQAKQEPLIVEKSKLKVSCPDEDAKYIELLFKLSLTYPAVTVPIMQTHPLPKRSFAYWFIKDFLVSQMINQTYKSVTDKKDQKDQPLNSDQEEVSFQIKTIGQMQQKLVFKAVNQLTCYNHLMTLNEQIVKHEIRTKFMLEALSILQKAIKDKNQNQLLQKCQIISALLVIESLINFQSPQLAKSQIMAKDNFTNSIRVAILRDSANKEQNLPQSFIKLADELLGDLVDVTLESNAEIINKVVSILTCLGEFINIERKKEEKKELRQNEINIPEERKQQEQANFNPQIIQQRQEPQPNRRILIAGQEDEDEYGDEIEGGIREDTGSDLDGDDDHLDNPRLEEDDQDDEDDYDEEEDDNQDENDDNDEDDDDDDDDDGDDADDQLILRHEDVDGDIRMMMLGGEHLDEDDHQDIFIDDPDEFDEDEDDDDDEQEQIHIDRLIRHPGGVAVAAAGQRQFDIINPSAQAAGNQNRHGGRDPGELVYRYRDINGAGGADQARRNPNWTEEESEVQRILTNLRGQGVVVIQPNEQAENRWGGWNARLDENGLIMGANPWGNVDPLGGPPGPAGQARQNGMIDQLYEELKTISDADLLTLVNEQRLALDLEFKTENKLTREKLLNSIPVGGQLNDRDRNLAMMLQRHDINPNRIIMDQNDNNMIVDLSNNEPARLIRDRIEDVLGLPEPFNINAPLDPMFARPNLAFDNPFQRQGGGGLLGDRYRVIYHRAELNQNRGRPGADAINTQLEFGLFNGLLRNQNQIMMNQNDDYGHQLLEHMDVQVEESKQEERKDQISSSVSQQQLERNNSSVSRSPRYQPVGSSSIGLNMSSLSPRINQELFRAPGDRAARIQNENWSLQILEEIERQAESMQNLLGQQQRQLGELGFSQDNNLNQLLQSDNSNAFSSPMIEQIQIQQQQQINQIQPLEQIMQEASQQIQQQQQQQQQEAQQQNEQIQDQINQINISDNYIPSVQSQQDQNQNEPMIQDNQNIEIQANVSEFSVQLQQQVQQEEQKLEASQENLQHLSQEEQKQDQQVSESNIGQSDDNKTFGYDNQLLLDNGIDPMILLELPEELRAELLSTIEIPQDLQQQQQQQQQQQEQQQPPQVNNNANANQQEEQKQSEQQQQQNQPGSGVNDIANELGLDPEFLANLPEDMQLELIQNEQFRQRNLGTQPAQQPPAREAEGMDIASFIASVVDPSLRREIFINMDENVIQTLPPNLMAEARQFQNQARSERGRYLDVMQNADRMMNLMNHYEPPHQRIRDEFDDAGFGGIFGRRVPGQGREEQKQAPSVGGRPLEEAVQGRHNQLFEELYQNEDSVQSLITQLSTDEKILEQLLLILISNGKIECSLIPCLQNLIKIHSNGMPVIRNKVINALTFLLKAISTNDEAGFKAIYPNAQLNKKRSALVLIGCLRLLLKNNRSLMKYILKGLIQKEDALQHQRGNQILKKQLKYLRSKVDQEQQMVQEEVKQTQLNPVEVSSLEDQIMAQTQQIIKQKSTQNASLNVPTIPPLAEIFYLIRTEMFKNDKSLLRNLSLLIHQILKQFDIALEELESSNQTISSETVQSIAEVLSLDIIDQTLMNDLGEFLFLISKKKRENFDLISSYCQERSQALLETLTQKLKAITLSFNDMRNRVSPGKQVSMIDNYSPSQGGDSVYEEEKSDMMMLIDTVNNPVQELKSSKSQDPFKNQYVKLQEEDERLLKQQLKLSDVSEILLRIFKLFNLFYQKFSIEKDKDPKSKQPAMIGDISKADIQQNDQASDVISYIKSLYERDQMNEFVRKVNEVLRIIYKTNIDVSESVSNLLFCVFEIYNPEMYESIVNEQKEDKLKQSQPSTESKELGKYQIKMLTLDESLARQKRQILFRNQNYFTNRIQELSNFCLANKRLINKLIKSKSQLFTNEVEILIKQMPNLLDFDNKRIYFKRELSKLKKSQYAEQIQLFIRRDNIFMDSYVQLGSRKPEEMKGRLHIQFTGERGQDAGGLTRDFFIELSREMFNPNYSLFLLSSSGSTYYPNPQSGIEKDHLKYFKFIGRVIGKALFDECLLECYFVKSLYKIMTGEALMFQDLEDFDNEFFNNLKWCISNDIETLYQTFVVEQNHFGRTQEIELIKDGAKTPVTNENKNLYIEQLTYFKLYKSIQQQIDSFLEGFYELIPKDLINIFNHKELELLISGLPNFDLNDLKQNTEYSGYNAQSPQIIWLWEILETFDNSERAEFLQFVTGSSKVPLDGFKGLMGMRGPQKFTVAKIKSDDILRLPSGHTCFNQIDIPEYPSKEIMHERLLTAIKETKGFGFA